MDFPERQSHRLTIHPDVNNKLVFRVYAATKRMRKKKYRELATVGLAVLLSMVLSGALCAIIWYQVGRRLPYYSPFVGNDVGAVIDAAIGAVLGLIGGCVIGLAVTSFRLGNISSFFVGFVINGLLPWALVAMLDGANSSPPDDVQRNLNYSSFGQAIVGGVVGLLISMLCSYMNRPNHDDLSG